MAAKQPKSREEIFNFTNSAICIEGYFVFSTEASLELRTRANHWNPNTAKNDRKNLVNMPRMLPRGKVGDTAHELDVSQSRLSAVTLMTSRPRSRGTSYRSTKRKR